MKVSITLPQCTKGKQNLLPCLSMQLTFPLFPFPFLFPSFLFTFFHKPGFWTNTEIFLAFILQQWYFVDKPVSGDRYHGWSAATMAPESFILLWRSVLPVLHQWSAIWLHIHEFACISMSLNMFQVHLPNCHEGIWKSR